MNDYSSALNQAVKNDFEGMKNLMIMYEPEYPNPSLAQRVTAINHLRSVDPKFITAQGIPDPAAPAIAELRSLMPPQVGLLLVTVPKGKGLLSAADGTRYTFWTECKYTMVIAQKISNSGLIVLPAGEHMLTIAAYGEYDPVNDDHDPIFDPPIQYACGIIQVQPGVVTEITIERRNNFSVPEYQVVYH